jgi:hypothetical protein
MLEELDNLPLPDLKPKLVAAVTDKATCAVKSTELLLGKLEMRPGEMLGLSCGAHNLDKVPSDIVKVKGCKTGAHRARCGHSLQSLWPWEQVTVTELQARDCAL